MGEQVDRYLLWFEEVCRRTARMVVEWDRVGFVHGVMNTDNMSILGLTIDYGPFGWLDSYDPSWTPNTTDLPGRRYAFGNQARVALWNLERLAYAVALLIPDPKKLESGLNAFIEEYNEGSKKMMSNKLGLVSFQSADQDLFRDLIHLFSLSEMDWTLFHRKLYEMVALGNRKISFEEYLVLLSPAVYGPLSEEFKKALKSWLENYLQRIGTSDYEWTDRSQIMKNANPKFIPRNYLLFDAIRGLESGDSKLFEDLYFVLKNPYEEHPEFEHFAEKRPDWAKSTPGCSTLSCSS